VLQAGGLEHASVEYRGADREVTQLGRPERGRDDDLLEYRLSADRLHWRREGTEDGRTDDAHNADSLSE
jgi:hypothetical protein